MEWSINGGSRYSPQLSSYSNQSYQGNGIPGHNIASLPCTRLGPNRDIPSQPAGQPFFQDLSLCDLRSCRVLVLMCPACPARKDSQHFCLLSLLLEHLQAIV